MNKLATCITTCLAMGLAIGSAAAQTYPNPEPPREGVLIGFGVQVGDISCGNCDGLDEAGGLEFHIGAMANPKLALLAEGWVMTHREDGFTVNHGIATLGVQAWLAPRIWIKGGLGLARGTIEAEVAGVIIEDETDTVPAAMMGIGMELITGRGFAMDLQLRGGTGFYENDDVRNAGLGVGLTWF